MAKIAVVGATGVVGRKIIQVLEERNFPVDEIYFFASKHSKGKCLNFKGENVIVKELTHDSFKNLKVDITLMSAGAKVSKEYAFSILKGSRYLIDNSSAFRKEKEVPLVIPEINFHTIGRARLIANPNCSTIQLVLILHVIENVFPIKRVVVTTFQSVSGAGKKMMDSLLSQTKAYLADKVIKDEKVIAFNLLPAIGEISECGYCKEEEKIMFETKKILKKDIPITATTVRVPVWYSHAESVNIEFKDKVDINKVKEVLKSVSYIKYIEDPLSPQPIHAQDNDFVFVGRIRQDFSVLSGINIWIVADNLRVGAATNAVKIAEGLLRR